MIRHRVVVALSRRQYEALLHLLQTMPPRDLSEGRSEVYAFEVNGLGEMDVLEGDDYERS